MRVTPYGTHIITPQEPDLLQILDRYLPDMAPRSVLAITSKIVAICQGRLLPMEGIDRQELIAQEAERYLPPATSKYAVTLTIKNGLLIPSAGIDASNADGHYVLWPEGIQAVADTVRAYLCRRFQSPHMGVVITDSTTRPLRWGVTGVAIAHSGFQALNDYRGAADIFGRPLQFTQVNVADGLAAAAVLMMGEGGEQTPLAVLEDLPMVRFQDRAPTPQELQALRIEVEDDLYAPLLQPAPWLMGTAPPSVDP